jgi:hypothetical protein
MKKIIGSLYLLVLALAAQAQNYSKYTNEFMHLGVNARNMAMGNATIATVNDATAGYYNPAGLASNYNARQMSIMHANYFSGLATYNYAGAGFRFNHENACGISFVRFGVQGIPNTLELIDNTGNVNYDKLRSFNDVSSGVLFSYGRQTYNESCKFGITGKIIRRKVGKFASAWGFGADVGVQKHVKTWHFGIVARDVTTTINTWNYNADALRTGFTLANNTIPQRSIEIALPRYTFAIGKEQQLRNLLSMTVEINADLTTDGKRNTVYNNGKYSIDPKMGVEFNYASRFYLRTGVANIQTDTDENNQIRRTTQPSLGVGISLKNLTFDYALINVGNVSQTYYSNIVSLKLDFGKIR